MYKPNFSGDTPQAQAAQAYTCIACEQQVQTIGGHLYVEDRADIARMPVCEPCFIRKVQDTAFSNRINARIEKMIRLSELQELCQRLGAPKEAFDLMATVAGLI